MSLLKARVFIYIYTYIKQNRSLYFHIPLLLLQIQETKCVKVRNEEMNGIGLQGAVISKAAIAMQGTPGIAPTHS